MAFPESRISNTLHGLSLQWIKTEDANMELMDEAIYRWLCPAFRPRSPIAVSGIIVIRGPFDGVFLLERRKGLCISVTTIICLSYPSYKSPAEQAFKCLFRGV